MERTLTSDRVNTVAEYLNLLRQEHSNSKALNNIGPDKKWDSLSTEDFLREVKYLGLGLTTLGIKKGSKVGLMSPSSTRWTIADFAIMSIGGVTVPLFANISEENFHFEVAQATIKTIFIAGEDPTRNLAKNKNLFSNVISLDYSKEKREGIISYDELIETGRQLDEKLPHLYDDLLSQVRSDDLATIIYTSGTTGFPQGVEHTHKSLFSMLRVNIFDWNAKDDSYVNVLPLAHVFARVLNLIFISFGISIYYLDDLKNFSAVCREIHPTILVVVPRLLEKVYQKMVANVQGASYMKRTIGQWAFDLANQEEETTWKHLFHPLAEKLVYTELRAALGGKIRVVLTGGAALNPHLYHFFLDIGVPIYEGWGLTEGCPITVNNPGKIRIGSIGLPIGDLKVRIGDNGELLAKGDNIMRGYYQNPEATARALDSEGWLHTGDKGHIDDDGYVYILGRLKEIFKTSTGKIVVPVPIEQALAKIPFVDIAMVIAEERKFVSCLLVPNFEILKVLKERHHVPNLTDAEFLNTPYIKEEMNKVITQINEHLNHWEQIHAYAFIPEPLKIEAGELTPSMKVVRKIVEKKYKPLIDEMYAKETNGDIGDVEGEVT